MNETNNENTTDSFINAIQIHSLIDLQIKVNEKKTDSKNPHKIYDTTENQIKSEVNLHLT